MRQIQVQDQGSKPQRANVVVGGVPMVGVIDTAADVSIMRVEMFKKVAVTAKIHKKDFKPVDRTPYTYDKKPFRLDGKLKSEISFQDRVMTTDIYVKMDASESLLLSEGVCRQLGIVEYHPDVVASQPLPPRVDASVTVPDVRVRLLQSVKLLPKPDRSVVADVMWECDHLKGPLLLEADPSFKTTRDIHVADVFVSDANSGKAKVVLTNCLGFTQKLESREEIGRVVPVDVVRQRDRVSMVTGEETAVVEVERRKQLLWKTLGDELNKETGGEQLKALLGEYHQVFSLSKKDRGETDMIELHIDTGDAVPQKYPVRRVPFAVREEIVRNLQEMQDANVIARLSVWLLANSSRWLIRMA